MRAPRTPAPARAGSPGYGEGLSPREHQVAALLAEGASNQRIAETLLRSPRSAGNHVAKVLKKLGSGRKQVADVYPGRPEGD